MRRRQERIIRTIGVLVHKSEVQMLLTVGAPATVGTDSLEVDTALRDPCLTDVTANA